MKPKKNPAHMRRIRALPCIACRILNEVQVSPTEAHHIRDGLGLGQKARDEETIPLCYYHHWNGVGSILTRKQFREEVGDERELLRMTLEDLERGEDAA